MVPFRYVEFFDVPRCMAVHHGGKLLLLESAFDEKLDDYSTHYKVYVLPGSVEDSLGKSPRKYPVPIGANPIGQTSVASVKFDASKRLALDPSCLDDLLGKRKFKVAHYLPTGSTIRVVKVRDLIRMVESDGWKHVRTTGSHRHFKHSSKPNVVTIPGHAGDDVPAGTLKSILRAAGLEDKK